MRIINGLARSLRDRGIGEDDTDAKLGWLLVVGTIPAGILGLLFEHSLRGLFASAQSAAFFLMLNGLMLFGAEALRRRAPQTDEDDDRRIARLVSFPNAFLVGAAQALALIPGFSRSGATMGGVSSSGCRTRTPPASLPACDAIIGAAALLKLPELFGAQGDGIRGQALVASRCWHQPPISPCVS